VRMRSAVPASVPGAPVRAGAVRIRDIPVHKLLPGAQRLPGKDENLEFMS
jgi:hypothetical protein